MLKKICNLWYKHRTKGFKQIPLLTVTFNYPKYVKDGEKGSCQVYTHPDIKEQLTHDAVLHELVNDVIDYIRDNYDMEQFTKL